MTFKNSNRYTVPTDEDFEPDSNNEVLKNSLNVKSKEQMEILEQIELERTEIEVLDFDTFDKEHQFTADDLCYIHKRWLGNIYPMAGKYRTVSMEKDGFPFAAPNQIENLMTELERKYLAKYTPCHFIDLSELAYALGVVHVEFILIHPFREGNGRTARLLADLMVMQMGKPPLNYKPIEQSESMQGFENYIKAIHAGFDGNYRPIQEIFFILIERSI